MDCEKSGIPCSAVTSVTYFGKMQKVNAVAFGNETGFETGFAGLVV